RADARGPRLRPRSLPGRQVHQGAAAGEPGGQRAHQERGHGRAHHPGPRHAAGRHQFGRLRAQGRRVGARAEGSYRPDAEPARVGGRQQGAASGLAQFRRQADHGEEAGRYRRGQVSGAGAGVGAV
ncbi:hypothetical protein LTR66_003478, partial [Elasticomyces elasticus]